jgi:hypothetical protein
MKPPLKSKIVAALLLGIVAALASYQLENSRHVMGKAAFLASQTERFDKYYVTLHPGWHYVAAGILLTGLVLATYELLALGIQFVLKPKGDPRAA